MYSNLVYTSFLVQHIRWLQQAITVIDTIWEGQWIENYLCTSAFAGNQMQDCSSKWGLLLTPPWPTSLTYTLVNLKTQKNTTFLLENRIFVYFEQYGSNSVACVLIILYLSQKKKCDSYNVALSAHIAWWCIPIDYSSSTCLHVLLSHLQLLLDILP